MGLDKEMDEFFSYDTVRYVRVKDYRLGIPNMVITFAIVVKIFVFTLVMAGGYLEMDTSILGSVRVTLQAPGERIPGGDGVGKVPRKLATDLDYCLNTCTDPGAGDCSGDADQERLLCPAVYSNSQFVQYPSLEGQGAVFLTTRVDSVTQTLPQSCITPSNEQGGANGGSAIARSTDPSCYNWEDSVTESWYISQIEDFLVKIDHSMLAPKAAEARTGYQMAKGEMLAHTSTDLKDTDPDLIDPCDDFVPKSSCPTPESGAGKWGVNVGNEHYTDVVKVKTLLRAAGLDANALDEKVKTAGDAAGKDWRLRHAGIVLILQIDYDNTWESVWGLYPNTEQYRYRYSVINVPDEGFKVTELRETDRSSASRTIYYRHGVRIILRQTGTIGAFSFASALTTCTTSLGLFAVATLIVDAIMQNAKRFADYHKMTLEETKMHSDKSLREFGRRKKKGGDGDLSLQLSSEQIGGRGSGVGAGNIYDAS